jgi:hypothetical protein
MFGAELRALAQRRDGFQLHQQLAMVQRTILRLALPGGKQRPKPGPYDGPMVRGKGEREAPKLTYTHS